MPNNNDMRVSRQSTKGYAMCSQYHRTFVAWGIPIDVRFLHNFACIVEDEFDIEIPDRAIKDFKTIGDVIAFIEKQ